jgi:transposase
MSLDAPIFYCVPDQTARVAKAAFPKGNLYIRMRDELGPLYANSTFAALFPSRGRPAEAPARLALVTVMQFVEGLSDRQAADAVRDRLAWKYALALELDDPGFDASVLCEFRARLIVGASEALLLESMLSILRDQGLLKARGKQRTDSTHVLAAIRILNRLECVGETLRHALNQLARHAPDWVRRQVPREWFDRYSRRIEDYRLPSGKAERQALAELIGADGVTLLSLLADPTTPADLPELPAIQILRRVWIQQYYAPTEAGQVRWRSAEDLPPAALMIGSPYDSEARYSMKRETTWTGYKVHVSETCDDDGPHLITHVETTPATTHDGQRTATIHSALAAKELLPSEHFVDTAYIDAPLLVDSRKDHQVELIGPVPADQSWQAKAGDGFDVACFQVNWEAKRVICPQGETSVKWSPSHDRHGNEVIHIEFARSTCRACAVRSQCTKAAIEPRELTLRPQAQHEALQAARQRQATALFKEAYGRRAGIEGTLSQGTRAFELRRSRYLGEAKTHLQHLATAAAINLVRLFAWFEECPRESRRISPFAALAPAG